MESVTFTQPKIRMGVVGVGNFGRLHALTLAGLAETELVAMVDSNEARLAEVSRELPGIPVWTDLNETLREVEAEAWVIATSTESHVPVAEQILSAGGHVLIEKPLAESLAAAQRLEPYGNRIMLGHILLFAAEFRQLLQQVKQRGPLHYLNLERHRPTTTWDYYRESPFRLTMVHDLYLAFALVGGEEPARISGRLRVREDGRLDLAKAHLEWPGGVWASLTASYLTPPGMSFDGFDRLEVFGQGWAGQVRLNPQPLQVWAARAEWPLALNIFADPSAPSGWLAEELRHFCRVVRGQAAPPLGARYKDALQIQRWLEWLETSAKMPAAS